MAEFIKYYKLDFAISPLYQEIIPVIYDLFLYVIHLYHDVFPEGFSMNYCKGKNVWASLNL